MTYLLDIIGLAGIACIVYGAYRAPVLLLPIGGTLLILASLAIYRRRKSLSKTTKRKR